MQNEKCKMQNGSKGSAACGRESDLSERPRSVSEEGALTPTRTPGTATEMVSPSATISIIFRREIPLFCIMHYAFCILNAER